MKAVIIYSGGMDSFTLLHQLKQGEHDVDEVLALSFNYGQRHARELDYAAAVCRLLDVPHKIIDMSVIGKELLQGSSLTSDDMAVPLGHYAEPSMKQTVVPNRNMIMLALATGYAVSVGAREVYTAVHAGDHAIYPDCRPEFIATMNQVTAIANYQPVRICAPYLFIDKRQILTLGLAMNLNYAQSWTCYNGRDKACGKCGSCTERLEAFKENGAHDPLPYENERTDSLLA